jgi:hypothetical protein
MATTYLPKESLFALIDASIGSKLFRHAYATVSGKKKDITEGGKLSCAFYVSTLLRMTGLIGATHTTIEGTLLDLKQSGWKESDQIRKGSVIVWERHGRHGHIGFSLGKGIAVSNSATKKYPMKHHETWRGKRKVIQVWNHEALS